ncbi:MAG TPA: MDR family MFS transporter [Candidatus Peribacteria bacterium]|nr:MDR family MFS transporter [Candidatus Peribacteria bacterium]
MEAKTARKPVRKGLILLTVIIGTFLGRLDQTIVNLALPKIINDFHITVTSAGWIATAYILANAIFVPIWGKLGDTIGRKKVYMLGFGLFIFGSVLAGFAWNLPSMILFRVIQAIAGSADYPTAMAIISVTYPTDKERGQALGIWSSAFAASAVLGPLIGGPLIDSFSWRSVFLINLPIGIVGMWMAAAYIEESVSSKISHQFDLLGAAVLGTAISAMVLVLDKGTEWGWTSGYSIVCFVTVVVGMLWFVRIEQNHPEPLLDLSFFKIRVFTETLINNFIIFMGMMGSIFLVPIFAQTFLGFNATQSGLLFVPMAVALMLGAPIGGILTERVQAKYVIAASTAVAGFGLFLFTRVDARSTAMDIMLPLAIMAFGMGFGMAQRTNVIASAVPKDEIGQASSVLALVRNVSGAFGVAIFSTLLTSSIESNVLSINRYSDFLGTTAAQYQEYVALIMLKAQINGYQTVFFYSTLLVVLGAVLALFMKNVKLSKGMQVHVE